MRAHNENLKRELDFLQSDIFQAQDQKKRQQQVIYQSKNDLRFKEKEVDDQTGKYHLLEKESKSLIERARHLNEQVDQKAIAVDKTSQRLEAVDRDIVGLK